MPITPNSITAKWCSSFKSTVSRFRKNETGQFAVIFAISSLAITMASGMALDGARLYSAKAKLNNAIDAAVLATTRDLTTGAIAEEDAEDAIGDFLFTNMEVNGVSGTTVVIDDYHIDRTNKTLEIEAHMMLPMTLAAIAGWNEVKVASSSKAMYGSDKIEVAMALDVTGSMGNDLDSGDTRMEALQSAAKIGFETLIPDEGAKERVRIGLVPYSASVNVKPVLSKIHYAAEPGVGYTGDSQGCVIERTGPQAYTTNFASATHPVTGLDMTSPQMTGRASRCPTNEIVPLTNDISKLNATVDAFRTGGTTAGHVGIAWVQYMLSANWKAAFTGDSEPASASDKGTRKFAVIMTDGLFNTVMTENIRVSDATRRSSAEYARGICDNIKSNDIQVFTIYLFDGDPTDADAIAARSLMQDCASPNTPDVQFFFNTSDADELEEAFRKIAEAISSLRLIS